MPVEIDEVIENLNPKKTVLFFGSGSTIPSGAPKVSEIKSAYSTKHKLPDDLDLSELSMLAELKSSRADIIKTLRDLIKPAKPAGGILDTPKYPWKSIFTTNYDKVIEQCYERASREICTISSNFDFKMQADDDVINLFKIHGTIDQDTCDGFGFPLVLTTRDYEHATDYREQLYDRLKGDLTGADMVIIGYSLKDPILADAIKRSAKLFSQSLSNNKIYLVLYEEDAFRASLFEELGINVCFGSVDSFFKKLNEKLEKPVSQLPSQEEFILVEAGAQKATISILELADKRKADASGMFNGWPASHADIAAGMTFERDLVRNGIRLFETEGSMCLSIIGAAGVGKSTASRQILQALQRASFKCWEHMHENSLNSRAWHATATALRANGMVGALFIDDAHDHLHEINDLIDRLSADQNFSLKLLLATSRNHWSHRVKSSAYFTHGKEIRLSQLTESEIDRLLNLVDRQPAIQKLVEESFSGFSRTERRRRLVSRCERDMFVCMKNIFATEAFDDIILREYATLPLEARETYRYVAAMESSGVRVHRQLVMRILRTEAGSLERLLQDLDDIIEEYSIEPRLGIYGWKCRHQVISNIITDHKFGDEEKIIDLLDTVIDKISPTYRIEISTIRSLCNTESGVSRLFSRSEQNRLLRKIISKVPGERVPRHRLIRNMIDDGDFEKAETEIRLFHSDFGFDGPVQRYRVKLLLERARKTPGIMDEDRVTILSKAHALAQSGARRFPNNRSILSIYAELGIEIFRRTGAYNVFDEAITALKRLRDSTGDPDIERIITSYSHRIIGHDIAEEPIDDSDDDYGDAA